MHNQTKPHPLDELKIQLSSLNLSVEQLGVVSKLMDRSYLAGRDKSPHFYNWEAMSKVCKVQLEVISELCRSNTSPQCLNESYIFLQSPSL